MCNLAHVQATDVAIRIGLDTLGEFARSFQNTFAFRLGVENLILVSRVTARMFDANTELFQCFLHERSLGRVLAAPNRTIRMRHLTYRRFKLLAYFPAEINRSIRILVYSRKGTVVF